MFPSPGSWASPCGGTSAWRSTTPRPSRSASSWASVGHLSFELKLAQIRDLSKCLDTELITYGRLPLMLMENCIIKNRTGSCGCQNTNILTDRKGARFPVVSAPSCRNELLNSQKLFLADKAADYRRIGLWAQRLLFTTENPRECVQVAQRYLEQGSWAPNEYTRGLYYRDVE